MARKIGMPKMPKKGPTVKGPRKNVKGYMLKALASKSAQLKRFPTSK